MRFEDSHQFKLKKLGSNHQEILLSFNNSEGQLPFVSKEEKGKFTMPVDFLWQEGLDISANLKLGTFQNPWLTVIHKYCHQILSNTTLHQELLAEKFDLAIVDLIHNECGLALAHHVLELPVMAYWAFSFSGYEAEFTTVATPPSHIPTLTSGLTDEMTFIERMWNSAMKYFFTRPLMVIHTFLIDRIIGQYFPKCPSSAFLLADLNGAMINTNFVLDYPRLQPTSFINVGGMQISPKPKPLSEDIKSFLDDAPHGVILFTMGFVFQPKAVPESRIQAIFDAFAQLSQKVIMKLDHLPSDSGIRVPQNVLLKPFLPQQDILAHENVVLFITHCGMHGVSFK